MKLLLSKPKKFQIERVEITWKVWAGQFCVHKGSGDVKLLWYLILAYENHFSISIRFSRSQYFAKPLALLKMPGNNIPLTHNFSHHGPSSLYNNMAICHSIAKTGYFLQ